MHGFWPVEALADGSTGCGEVASGGCLLTWNFNVTRSTVLTESEKKF